MTDDVVAGYGDANAAEHGYETWTELSARLIRSLEEFVLLDNCEIAVDRLELLEHVVDRWRLVVDDTDAKDVWLTQREAPRFVRSDDGSWLETHEPELTEWTMPLALFGLLRAEILDQPEATSLDRVEALADLVGIWMGYYVDVEKLHGHLSRRHRYVATTPSVAHEVLLTEHARRHGVR